MKVADTVAIMIISVLIKMIMIAYGVACCSEPEAMSAGCQRTEERGDAVELLSRSDQSASSMQFEMRLQTVVGEFYQHCNGLLPDCRLLLANSNQVECD